MFKTWDSAHYLFLSEEGYGNAGASRAFYPLWPTLIGIARPLFGSSLLAALVLANLLSIAGLTILHRLANGIAGHQAADATLLLSLAYPGAIYYCFPYTESLFLLITVSVFFLLSKGRLAQAAGLSILAPPTRAVGVFLIIPLAWQVVADWRKGNRPWWHVSVAAAPLVGVALTLGFMWAQTGNAFAGIEAQASFASQGAITKLFAPLAFFRSFVDVWGVHGVLHSGLDRVFFVFAILGIAATARLERGVGPLTSYAAALILVPAVTMSFMSFIRDAAPAFPIFIGFGAALCGYPRREMRWSLVACLLIIQFFFLIRHVNSMWVA
jgi:Gpi18-like mannosyltransferase